MRACVRAEVVGVEHDIQQIHAATMLSIVGICVRLYVCGHEERGSEYCGVCVCVCSCCVRVVGEGMISPRGTQAKSVYDFGRLGMLKCETRASVETHRTHTYTSVYTIVLLITVTPEIVFSGTYSYKSGSARKSGCEQVCLYVCVCGCVE